MSKHTLTLALRITAILITASLLTACNGAEAATPAVITNPNLAEELHRPYTGVGEQPGYPLYPAYNNGSATHYNYENPNENFALNENNYNQTPQCNGDYDNPYYSQYVHYCLDTAYENSPTASAEPVERIRSTIDPDMPMIALTFDDGPIAPYTEYILDVLERYNARGTFFVIGQEIYGNEDIIRRAFYSGNEIAGHSWSHPLLPFLSAERVYEEIMDTHNAIYEITGYMPQIFRPPYGRTDGPHSHVGRITIELGLPLITWNIDPRDWYNRCAYTTWSNIMDRAANGAIVLVHENVPTTAVAMEYVIPQLIDMGFQLVTVSELFYHNGIEPRPGFVYRNAVVAR